MLDKFYRFLAVFILLAIVAVFLFFGFFMAIILVIATLIIRLLFYFSKERKNGTIVVNGQVIDVEYQDVTEENKNSEKNNKDHQ